MILILTLIYTLTLAPSPIATIIRNLDPKINASHHCTSIGASVAKSTRTPIICGIVIIQLVADTTTNMRPAAGRRFVMLTAPNTHSYNNKMGIAEGK